MHSRVEDTRTLSLTILRRILTFLYADFLEADESISIGEHHCSLLHPCVSISTSTPFKPIYTFRLIASQWNKVFLSMARLDRYGSHQIVQGPRNYHTIIYTSLRKSVILGRYRVFHTLDTEHGTYLVNCTWPYSFANYTRLSRCVCGIWFWRHWWMQRIHRGDHQSLGTVWLARLENRKQSV